jgi:hypothetical protein
MNKPSIPQGSLAFEVRPTLVAGNHYFSFPCKKCGHEEPVLDDPYNGEKSPQEVLRGEAAVLGITCSACKHNDEYRFTELQNYRHPVTDQG